MSHPGLQAYSDLCHRELCVHFPLVNGCCLPSKQHPTRQLQGHQPSYRSDIQNIYIHTCYWYTMSLSLLPFGDNRNWKNVKNLSGKFLTPVFMLKFNECIWIEQYLYFYTLRPLSLSNQTPLLQVICLISTPWQRKEVTPYTIIRNTGRCSAWTSVAAWPTQDATRTPVRTSIQWLGPQVL